MSDALKPWDGSEYLPNTGAFINTKSKWVFRNESSFFFCLCSAVKGEKILMFCDDSRIVSASRIYRLLVESNWNEYPSFRHLWKEPMNRNLNSQFTWLGLLLMSRWQSGTVSAAGLPAAKDEGPLLWLLFPSCCWHTPRLQNTALMKQRYLMLSIQQHEVKVPWIISLSLLPPFLIYHVLWVHMARRQ